MEDPVAANKASHLGATDLGCARASLPYLRFSFLLGRVSQDSSSAEQADVDFTMASGVLCGAAASGNFTWTPEHVAQSLVCMTMSGPFLTGYTQTINDYYDREIDAINEPNRPIPSGTCTSCRHMTADATIMTNAELLLLARPFERAIYNSQWNGCS